MSNSAGPALQLSDGSRGAAFGDLDNDGDVDIVVSNNEGPARLLLNESGNQRNWLLVQLIGANGRDPAGARVGVQLANNRTLWRRAAREGSFLSASDIRVHFGLGDAANVQGIQVRWPDGSVETFPATRTNQLLRLKQGSTHP